MTRKTQAELREQFEALALVHLDRLYNFALKLTHQQEAAQDLVQDTCLKAWRKFYQYRDGSNCIAWLMTIINAQRKVEAEVQKEADQKESDGSQEEH